MDSSAFLVLWHALPSVTAGLAGEEFCGIIAFDYQCAETISFINNL